MNKKTQSIPLAYFITFTTYGTRIRGDKRETVDRFHNAFDTPYIKENNFLNTAGKIKMSDDVYLLNHQHTAIHAHLAGEFEFTGTIALQCELDWFSYRQFCTGIKISEHDCFRARLFVFS